MKPGRGNECATELVNGKFFRGLALVGFRERVGHGNYGGDLRILDHLPGINFYTSI